MKKIIVSTLILSLVVLGIGNFVVDAQGGPGSGYRFNDDMQRPYYGQSENLLDLTDEQAEQMADIRQEFFDNRIELTEQLQDKRFELREEILKNESPEKISALEDEIANLQEEINSTRQDYYVKLRSILTEEQIGVLLENEGRFGLYNQNSRFDDRSYGFNRMPMGGNRFDSYQSRTYGGMRGGFRAPVRGHCF